METPNTKNPFSECKIIGTVEREAYCKSEYPRGHVEFAMSRGELMECNRCPHRWLMGYKSDESKAQEWGSLIDCLVLTPERFDSEFAITPEEYPGTPKRKSDPIEMKPWNKNAGTMTESIHGWKKGMSAGEWQSLKPKLDQWLWDELVMADTEALSDLDIPRLNEVIENTKNKLSQKSCENKDSESNDLQKVRRMA
jgi:hypothetical protein